MLVGVGAGVGVGVGEGVGVLVGVGSGVGVGELVGVGVDSSFGMAEIVAFTPEAIVAWVSGVLVSSCSWHAKADISITAVKAANASLAMDALEVDISSQLDVWRVDGQQASAARRCFKLLALTEQGQFANCPYIEFNICSQ